MYNWKCLLFSYVSEQCFTCFTRSFLYYNNIEIAYSQYWNCTLASSLQLSSCQKKSNSRYKAFTFDLMWSKNPGHFHSFEYCSIVPDCSISSINSWKKSDRGCKCRHFFSLGKLSQSFSIRLPAVWCINFLQLFFALLVCYHIVLYKPHWQEWVADVDNAMLFGSLVEQYLSAIRIEEDFILSK